MLKYSKISKYKLKKVIKCFCIDIDATKTSLLLGFNRKTINRYFNIFREAIYQHQIEQFKSFVGEVEVDESYFGASRIRGNKVKLKRGRGTLKQPVFGIFQRNGKVYTEVIPDCKKKTLQSIIRGRIDPSSAVYSDGWRGYDGFVDVGYDKHFRINHGNSEFARKGRVHVNGIENFWSFTKRRLAKFNGVKTNFHLHLKESEWRYGKNNEVLEKELYELVNSKEL